MKPLKIVLVVLLVLINLVIVQSSWADRIAKKSPDYPQVIQNLDALVQLRDSPEQTEYTTEELQQKIADLKLQKYILETSEDWGQCRNETGKILAIYAHKAKNSNQNNLYYLGSGEVTDDGWDCEGIYLPSDAKVAGLDILSGEPSVVKIVDGTVLVATTNPTTGEIEFNTPSGLITVLNSNQVTWPIPNLAQADIDVQVPNAPID